MIRDKNGKQTNRRWVVTIQYTEYVEVDARTAEGAERKAKEQVSAFRQSRMPHVIEVEECP
jgi:hypothetical protein